jgi:acyl CoA:acetate/3-ketoacid CoA transferase beta subunit
MEHTVDGEPRLLKQCTLPITAPGVVKLVFTDLGVFQPLGDAFRLVEIAPGYKPEEVQALTGAPLTYDAVLKEIQL